MSAPTVERRSYGSWHNNASAGLFNLGLIPTIGAFALGVVELPLFLLAPKVALIVGAAGLVVLAPMAIRIKGRTGAQVAYAHLAWWAGTLQRHHLYRTGLASPYTTAHRLPGLLASSELLEVEDGRTGRLGIIALPASRHVTAVLLASAEGIDLVDQTVIDQRVAHWSAWLASLGREQGLVQAQVIIETAPDPGTKLAAEVAATVRPDAPELARSVLSEIVESFPAGAATTYYYVALTWRLTGRDLHAAAVDAAARVPALAAGLEGTGAIAVRAATPDELIRIVARGFDPQRATEVDAAPAHLLDWAWAGPVDHDEARDTYAHDSGLSRSWGLLEAPRGAVVETAFARLAQPDPALAGRKRVSLIYRPLDPATAARTVETDRRDAEFNAGKRARPSARDLAAIRAAEQAAAEEARGAGVVRFSILATLTVPRGDGDRDALAEADRRLLAAAGEARIALRLMGAAQAATFAANLPTGIVLSHHALLT